MSEVCKWLKNLPAGGLHLEKCSKEFENRGFHTLRSLTYLRPGDIDAFFPSPEKLLLAEKRILESEIKAIVDPALTRPGFTGGFCVTALMTSVTNPSPSGG